MAFSVCDRSKRWRYFCTVLPYISGMHGASGAYDGACCKAEPAEKVLWMSYKALEKEGSKWHITDDSHAWLLHAHDVLHNSLRLDGCVFL